MFIENAKDIRNDWWRYFIVGPLIIIFFSQILGALPVGIGIGIAAAMNGGLEDISMENSMDIFNVFASKNTGLALLLLIFAIGLLGIYITVKYLHGQSFKSLTTSRKKVDYSRILYSFTLISVVIVSTFFIDYFINPSNYELNFNLNKFLVLLLVCLTLLPMQTSFEEYLCRGYLLQGIGIVTKSRALAFTIPSILFGLLHFANPEIDKLGNFFMIYYIIIGFALGVVTLMDEGLELALGWHYANNFAAALLVSADWSAIQTDAVFTYIAEPEMSTEILLSTVLFSIIIYHFSIKYKWSGWKEKLFGKVII